MNLDIVPRSPLNRREFIGRLALAGATVPFVDSVTAAEAHGGRISEAVGAAPVPARREASIIHVFTKPLEWLSYEETAELVAEAGYGGLDLTVRPGGHVLPERVEDDLPRAVDAAQRSGLKVEMITTAIVDADDPHTERILKTAAPLGVKCYRLGTLDYDLREGVQMTLDRLKPVFRDLAALNKQYGLHGAYQNHAGPRIGGPVWDIHELVRNLDPRWIGCQYDIRHATVEGGQSWPLGLRLLRPWIRCTDIKDFIWNQSPGLAKSKTVPLGKGIVNFDHYFRLVRELDVGGPISVHFEYKIGERMQDPMSSETARKAQFAVALKNDLTTLQGHLVKHGLA